MLFKRSLLTLKYWVYLESAISNIESIQVPEWKIYPVTFVIKDYRFINSIFIPRKVDEFHKNFNTWAKY